MSGLPILRRRDRLRLRFTHGRRRGKYKANSLILSGCRYRVTIVVGLVSWAQRDHLPYHPHVICLVLCEKDPIVNDMSSPVSKTLPSEISSPSPSSPSLRALPHLETSSTTECPCLLENIFILFSIRLRSWRGEVRLKDHAHTLAFFWQRNSQPASFLHRKPMSMLT